MGSLKFVLSFPSGLGILLAYLLLLFLCVCVFVCVFKIN